MRAIENFLDFYILSNIHVALATFCLTKITLISFDISTNELAWFVFFSTILAYNYIRLYRKAEIRINWFADWIIKFKKIIYILCLISSIGIFFYGYELKRITIFALVPLAFVTLFYVLPFGKGKSLRSIARFKLFLIAFCWASVTVLLPVINYEIQFSKDVLLIFLQRLLFIMAITIPFDIRDLNFDANLLKTLPQMVGIEKSKRIGLLFLMLFLGLNFLKSELDIQALRVELIVTLVSLFFLVRANDSQHKYYSAFFVEAIPIVWLLLILLLL